MAMAMKGAMGVALALLIALSIVLTVVADGECSADSPCPNSEHCCSQWGYCGTGDPYCGNGCQGGPCNPSIRGGALADGQCSSSSPCPNSKHCCSQWGYCGTGDDFCGNGCQAGPCKASIRGAVVTDGQCSSSSPCPNSKHCCSQWGYCGTGDDFCGNGCQAGPCKASIRGAVVTDGQCSSSSPCPNSKHCCSQWGYCGTGDAFCGNGCQAGPCTSGTPSTGGGGSLGDILTRNLYEQLFPGHIPFYSYDKLIEASKSFPQFGTTGDTNTRKREIAAFAAHVTQETSGLKKIVEQTNDPYCDPSRRDFPCNGKHFNGRGPLQLSWNYNYGPCGNYLKTNLLANPDLVATDPLISFKSSLWFWNQYGDNVIPHIHDVITGNWKPTSADKAANRVPGFGVTIVIINGNLECGKQSAQADNRVNYFKNFCSKLNVSPGDNLDCKKMKPFYGVNLVAEA